MTTPTTNLLDHPTLWAAWEKSFQAFGVKPSEMLYVRVFEAWGSTHRRYHTRRHLQDCLNLLTQWSQGKPWPARVALALFFHDAVYAPLQSDNEERSARMAQGVLTEAGVPVGAIEEIEALIMATRHAVAPSTPDEKLLIDIDLAILGAAPARYQEYAHQVREEYIEVPDEIFFPGRLRVLEGFLGPEGTNPIFHTPQGLQAFDAPARSNLAAEIERIRNRLR